MASAAAQGINCDGVQDSADPQQSHLRRARERYFALPDRRRRAFDRQPRAQQHGADRIERALGRSTSRMARRTRRRATTSSGTIIRSAAASPSARIRCSGFADDNNALMDRFTTDGGDTILTLAEWRQLTGLDTHSFVSTPAALFANVLGSGDYRLAATSPALDAGRDARGCAGRYRRCRAGRRGPAMSIGAFERPAGDFIFADGFDFDGEAQHFHRRPGAGRIQLLQLWRQRKSWVPAGAAGRRDRKLSQAAFPVY